MHKAQAIEVLKDCTPLYQHLRYIPRYKPKAEELVTLRKFKQIFEAGLIQDRELLEAAGLRTDQVGLLVGYMIKLTP